MTSDKQAACPVCANICKKSFQKDPVTYYACDKCNSMFIWPMPTVEQMKAYANQQYRDGVYSDYLKAKNMKLKTFEGRISEILSLAQKTAGQKSRHLDVGCSAGFMIEVGLKNGFDSYGVEFSKEAISQAKPEIQSRIQNIDVNELNLADQDKFDLITCFDIVEHIQDPQSFLTKLRNLLKPGGLLALTTPDPEHYIAKIMGTRWPMLQPMQHTILFSKKGLNSVLEKTGFEELVSRGAYKVLTFDYLSGQLQELNPVLSKLMSTVSKVTPAQISNKPLKVNISEFISISRAR